MSEKKLATSKFSFGFDVGFVLTPFLLCLVILFSYLSFKKSKPDVDYLVITTFFLIITSWQLYKILRAKRIVVYKGYFTVRNVFGSTPKKFTKSDILHYAIKSISSRYIEPYATLRLYLKDKHIDISEKNYDNYGELKNLLTRGVVNTTEQRIKKQRLYGLIGGTFLLIFVITIVWIGFTAIININNYTKKSTLSEYYIIIPILITLICLIGIYYTWKDYRAK